MVSFNLETLEIETNERLSVCNRANDPENPLILKQETNSLLERNNL